MKPIVARTEWLLFAIALVAFGYFHQGGGWNANSRFAMVRAIVEQGELSIDSYLIYTPVSDTGTDLRRIDLQNASYVSNGKTNVLVWLDRQGKAFPIDPKFESQTEKFNLIDLKSVAASGDVSYYGGHFYPNKAPGTSFLAMPAYWIIHQVEKIAGRNSDDWWTLTLNAWLTSVFSVGLLSAFGVVLFYRLALQFSNGMATPALLAALTFAFGTMFFPYATCLYEHNIIAVCLLASFYFLHRAKSDAHAASTSIFAGGLCAGYAAITNYIIAIIVVILGIYLLLSVRRKNGWLWFGLGLLGPLLLICAYNVACFDTAFTTNYRHQNPYFRDSENAFLDVFVLPRPGVLVALLFSPFRGLFFSSPVLIMAVTGLILGFRDKKWRTEIWLAAATIAFLLFFNTSFEAWEGGWAVAPRYLGPSIPFLALGLAFGFARFRKTTCLFGGLSIAIMLLITAVDPQPSIGVSDTARVLDKPPWQYNPITEYELPIFLRDRPWPLIQQQERQVLRYYQGQLAMENLSETERVSELGRFQSEIEKRINAQEPAPTVLKRDGRGSNAIYSIEMSDVPTIVGPVSVNVGGIYGGGMLGSDELRWNSFNAGEFLFPQSRWSLLPLLCVGITLGYFAVRTARTFDLTRT